MPVTKAPAILREELPEIATLAEVAAFERIDVRTLRSEIDAGRVPGAYRRGRSWRVDMSVYNAARRGEVA